MVKMTGTTFPADEAEFSTAPPPNLSEQKSYNTLQQQYDDIPCPPKKEAFHEEAEDAEEEPEVPVLPTAPPNATEGVPPSADLPLPPSNFPIDDDLSRRLAELRKR